MIRKFTNVSGSPEKKMRRQSPVIGGARFYPGSSQHYDDRQWEHLGKLAQDFLMSLVAIGVLDYEERLELAKPSISAKNTELSSGALERDNLEEEVEIEPVKEIDTVDKVKVDIEPTEKVNSESKDDEEDDSGIKTDSFDYEGFLEDTATNIKKKGLPDPRPNIEKLIAIEMSNNKRKSVIAWLEQQSG